MAGAPTEADPEIPPKEVPSRAPEESIEAARRLKRVRANLCLLDRPGAMPTSVRNPAYRVEDNAAVTFASREFAKVYIQVERLSSTFFERDVNCDADYMTSPRYYGS
jgi:hypothetical protein